MWDTMEASIVYSVDFVCHKWLLKVSMQIESGPARYLNFCKHYVTWSFYRVEAFCVYQYTYRDPALDFHGPLDDFLALCNLFKKNYGQNLLYC